MIPFACTNSSAPREPSQVKSVWPVAPSRQLMGASMPSVTNTRSLSPTSRRVSCVGPDFSGQRCVFHDAMGSFHSTVPLNASRAMRFHFAGSRMEMREPSSMM